jgi:hypothetical protein
VIFLTLIVVMFAYTPTAVWMLDWGGLRRLWLTFGIALCSIISLGFLVSWLYDVRNTTRLVLFVSGLGGATLLCTTVFLHLSDCFHWGQGARALAALCGCIVGVVTGMLLVVYGLRTW